jgi:hypothetical protein
MARGARVVERDRKIVFLQVDETRMLCFSIVIPVAMLVQMTGDFVGLKV